MNSSYGIQIKTGFGIMQIVYSAYELHATMRKHLTDRFPSFEPHVPDDENHEYRLTVGGRIVGYCIIDADSYGEVECFVGPMLKMLLRRHHESKGLKVLERGEMKLTRWAE